MSDSMPALTPTAKLLLYVLCTAQTEPTVLQLLELTQLTPVHTTRTIQQLLRAGLVTSHKLPQRPVTFSLADQQEGE
jgi:hypothetical protein